MLLLAIDHWHGSTLQNIRETIRCYPLDQLTHTLIALTKFNYGYSEKTPLIFVKHMFYCYEVHNFTTARNMFGRLCAMNFGIWTVQTRLSTRTSHWLAKAIYCLSIIILPFIDVLMMVLLLLLLLYASIVIIYVSRHGSWTCFTRALLFWPFFRFHCKCSRHWYVTKKS